MNKQLSNKIANANVFLTILIVMLHFGYANNRILSYITDMAVPCFFSISSFLYFWSFDWNSPSNSYLYKLKSRFKSVVIPFFIFNIIAYLVFVVIRCYKDGIFTFDDFSLRKIWLNQFDMPTWYLKTLYQFVIVAPVIGYIIKKSKYSISFFFFVLPIGIRFHYGNLLFFLPSIILGSYMSIYYKSISSVLYKKKDMLKILIPVSIIIIIVLFLIFEYNQDKKQFLYYIYRQVSSIFIIIIYLKINIIPDRLYRLIKPYTFLFL